MNDVKSRLHGVNCYANEPMTQNDSDLDVTNVS